MDKGAGVNSFEHAGTGAGEPHRVLVIGGWGRCGSTLLDMMLGQVAGFVSAGEVRELWLRGCVENRPCGCGVPFSECPFWSQVGDAAFGGWQRLDLERILRVRYSLDRPWGVPRLLADRRGHADFDHYSDALARLFGGIRAVSGARVVIDSSKLPTHTMILSQTSGVDVRLVHLVRDSRGVAYSNTKRVVKTVTNGEPTLLPTHGAFSASARYALYNGLTQSAARKGVDYMLLRYEDLIAEPETNLRAVIRHAGEPAADAALPFLTEQGVLLAENHLVDGNPVRFAKGAVPLRADEEWRTKMRPGPRRAVTALTLPFLATYRYPLR
jgi:hypothetical protein